MRNLLLNLTVLSLYMWALSPSKLVSDNLNLRIAVEGAYPPFNQINLKGELEGFDVEIAKEICLEIKSKCQFIAVPWEGIIPGLLAKNFDVIVSSMSITPEREKQVSFTQNYYRLGAVLVAQKSKGVKVTDKLKVGVQRGATYEKYAKKLNPNWELKIYEKAKDHNKDLELGRIDAALGQQVVMSDFVSKNNNFSVVAGPFYDKEILGVGAGIAFRKDDTKLLKLFDDAIKKLKTSGKLKKLASAYFNFNIFGPQE